MPCIQIKTNKPISSEKQAAIKEKLGKAIEVIPRKSEKWLMCIFHPECGMWFQGRQSDLAFVEVGIFGQPEKEACDALTGEIMGIIGEQLNIEPDHIYVQYVMTPYWGWNGKNF